MTGEGPDGPSSETVRSRRERPLGRAAGRRCHSGASAGPALDIPPQIRCDLSAAGEPGAPTVGDHRPRALRRGRQLSQLAPSTSHGIPSACSPAATNWRRRTGPPIPPSPCSPAFSKIPSRPYPTSCCRFARTTRPELIDVKVRGGAIVAWGDTDIDDPESELHRRYEIGVSTNGTYHSVDPGKLTMAPYFAEVCADRIMASGLA